MLRLPLLAGALAASAPAVLAAPQADAPAPGFSLDEVHPPPIVSDLVGGSFDAYALTARLSSGQSVVFDGQSARLYGDTGLFSEVLLHLAEPGFPAFVRIDPSETFALIAESTFGQIFRVPLDGTGGELLAETVLPFDADFEGPPFGVPSSAIVGAATCGWSCGSDLLRLDLSTGELTPLAHVGGPSGPVAVDPPTGDLYYGLFDDDLLEPKSVVRFPAALLTGDEILGAGDAEVVGTGYSGAASLIVDPFTGSAQAGGLLLAENDAVFGGSAIVRVGGERDGEVFLQGKPWVWISDLQYVPGDGPGVFHAYQPAGGGAVYYTSTYFAFDQVARRRIRPARPAVDFSGQGAKGPGFVTLELSGGPENGFAVLLHAPLSSWTGTESVLPVAGLPWVSGVPLPGWSVWPEAFALDDDGAFSIELLNGTGATSVLVVQAACFTADGVALGLSAPAAL